MLSGIINFTKDMGFHEVHGSDFGGLILLWTQKAKNTNVSGLPYLTIKEKKM